MNSRRWYAGPLMRINKAVAGRVRNSPLITKLLFGVRVVRGRRPQFWDYTTLVLVRAVREYARTEHRTLEIGVGENAIISLAMLKHCSADAFGVDLEADVIETARKAAKLNRLKIDLRQSDMFEVCRGQFDLVFWNPPYVPADAPKEGLVGEQSDVQSDGGDDGTTIIRRFVAEAAPFLKPDGRILLGFSAFYVSVELMQSVIDASPFLLDRTISAWPNPSKVFVLRHRKEAE